MKNFTPSIISTLAFFLAIGIPFMSELVNAECCWDGCKGFSCNPCWSQSKCGFQGSCPAVYCHRSYERGTLSPDTVAAEARKSQQDATSSAKVARVLGSFKEGDVNLNAFVKRDAGKEAGAQSMDA